MLLRERTLVPAADLLSLQGAVPVATPVLTAETVEMLDALPPELPSLTTAFSRRKAIFGAMAATVGSVAALPALAAPAAADADIIGLADQIKQLSIECDRLTDQRAAIEDHVMTEGPRRPEAPPKPSSRTNIVHRDTATERVMVVSFQLDPDPVEMEWERARDAAKEAFDRDRTAMEESLGLPEVCGRLDRNWMRLQQSAADLAEMEPRTSAGLAAKAAALMSIDSVGGIDDLGVDLALSIATDAVRLYGMGGARV